MMQRQRSFAPTLSALALGAWVVLQPAAAQIPNAPGTPIGTPLGSPGAVDAPQMAPQPVPPNGPAAQDTIDPPGRVGRLGEVSGQAWLYNPDTGEWVQAERNRPLTTGDRLATDAGARVEVYVGSTTLRLDGDTEVEVERLDDGKLALRLHNGSLATRIRSQDVVREFELLTGEGRFTVQRTGRYRFDRNDEASHVTVYAGQARYEGNNSALTVYAGQRGEFWIDSHNTAQYSLTDPVRDAFAAWTGERDRADDRSASQRYVSPEMTGAEELDRYGAWQQSPEYGALWVPRTVSPGWAPYTTGRWVWVSPWGWTWVDEAPWGFAPFHYGRWVNVSNVWCWSPGTYVRRPVYAPALVAWIGGPRLSVSLTVGGPPAPAVGWVPLAPREVYVPGYRVSPTYVRNVNVTHVTNITNITTIINNPQQAVSQQNFANRKFPHAVTVVPADVVTQRRPVAAIAQEYRDRPDVRRFADDRTRLAVSAAPPVAAPALITRRLESGAAGPGAPRTEVIPPPPGRMRPPALARPNADTRPNMIEGRPNGGPAALRPGTGPQTVAPVAPNAPAVPPAARPTPSVPAQAPAIAAPARPSIDERSGMPREPNRGMGRGDAPAPERRAQPVPAPQAAPQVQPPQPQALPPGRARQVEPSREAQQAREQQVQRAQQEQQARQAQQAQAAQRAQQAAQAPQVPPAQQAQQAQQARAAEEQRRAAAQAQQQERARAAQEQQAERGRGPQEPRRGMEPQRGRGEER